MTSEKPESKQEEQQEKSDQSLDKDKEIARNFVTGIGQKSAQVLIQWMPLGGSGITFISSVLNHDWVIAVLSFPVMMVTVIWANYTESFLKRLGEVFEEKGKQDADKVPKLMETITKTISWQLAGTDDKYLKCQGNECVQYKTEGLNNIFRPSLSDVFVSLELSGSFLRDSEDRLLPLFPGFSWERKITQETLSKEGLNIWYILKQAQKNQIYRSLIIQAWGGYGKTTLVRHITYIYAKKLNQKSAYDAPNLLPVLLYLRKWQELISKSDAPDLPTLIEKHHIPDLPEGKALKLPPNWAINHLRQGNMLVMLDGFDEVKEEWQKSVSEWIGKHLKDYPQTFFILTSRPAAYHQYQSENKPNTSLFVKPFNQDQQERFLQRWYLSWERHLSAEPDQPIVKVEAERKASSLVQQLKPIEGEKNPLSDFAKNPLLLNMIVNLHSSYPDGKLPQSRADLYRSIVRLQLGDRPLSRQIDMLLEPNESQQILQQLALFLVQENLTKIEPEKLLEKLQEYLIVIDESISTELFLKKIEQVSELLVKVDDLYEFAHKSFQEYLAAVEIKRTEQEDLLLQHWQDQWWEATILLYVAQLRNPSLFIGRLTQIKTPEAISLAFKCLKETSREVDPEVQAELQSLSSTIQDSRYQKLETLLKNQQFKEADNETYKLMIKTVGKEVGQWFDPEDLENFPCDDLRTIDQLWVKYSQGRFGFSVQKKIYIDELGGTKEYNREVWEKFSDRVGWRKGGNWLNYELGDLNFELRYELLDTTPVAHLPFCGGWLGGVVGGRGVGVVGGGWGVGVGFIIFSRAQTCNL